MTTRKNNNDNNNLFPRTLDQYRTVSVNADTIVDTFTNEWTKNYNQQQFSTNEENDHHQDNDSNNNERHTGLTAQHLFVRHVIQHETVEKYPVPLQLTHKVLKRYIFVVEHDRENEDGVSEDLMDLYWQIASGLPTGQDSFSQRHLEASHRIYDLSSCCIGNSKNSDRSNHHHNRHHTKIEGELTNFESAESGEIHNDEETHDNDENLIVLKVWPRFTNVGLGMWEAGYYIAEWILANGHLFRGKRVLELGSGVGLTAMALARSFDHHVSDEELPRAIYMTDYMNVVLNNCVDNLKLNHLPVIELFESSSSSSSSNLVSSTSSSHHSHHSHHHHHHHDDESDISSVMSDVSTCSTSSSSNMGPPHRNEARLVHVAMLDWTKFSDEQLQTMDADIILAADVVYDISVIEALTNVTSRLIFHNRKRKPSDVAVYFAVTKRNENTFAFFKEQCAKRDIFTEEITDPELPQLFPYEGRDTIHMFKLSTATATSSMTTAE